MEKDVLDLVITALLYRTISLGSLPSSAANFLSSSEQEALWPSFSAWEIMSITMLINTRLITKRTEIGWTADGHSTVASKGLKLRPWLVIVWGKN